MESDTVVPPTLYEVVEAVSPEGRPITMHLDYEHAGRGFEAGLEDIRSRLVELTGAEKWGLEPRVYGLFNVPGAGRQEQQGENGKGESGRPREWAAGLP